MQVHLHLCIAALTTFVLTGCDEISQPRAAVQDPVTQAIEAVCGDFAVQGITAEANGHAFLVVCENGAVRRVENDR